MLQMAYELGQLCCTSNSVALAWHEGSITQLHFAGITIVATSNSSGLLQCLRTLDLQQVHPAVPRPLNTDLNLCQSSLPLSLAHSSVSLTCVLALTDTAVSSSEAGGAH